MASARDRALDFLTARYRESLDLVPVRKVPYAVYGLDLEGWDVFVVGRKSSDTIQLGVRTTGPHQLGGSEHVAVNRITGEVRYLGILGE
jgi:hypothetical protein